MAGGLDAFALNPQPRLQPQFRLCWETLVADSSTNTVLDSKLSAK
jgi:hypothetical protein